MKFNLLRIALVSFLAFLAVVFSACDVGLGEAVDTMPPVVGITLPTADYIIKDEFVMSGTCSDDKGVVSVEVSLKNTSTKKVYPSYYADIDSSKDTWSCKINPLSTEKYIPDGTYEATVTASDKSGRKTAATKSFIIDNTPPILVLTRPSTKIAAGGTQTYDTYGAEFDITGQVADDNNIEKLVVSIYEDAAKTKHVKDVELKNVPPTIDLAVAKWGEKEGDLAGIYEKIYGTEKAGTKAFYCSITIYDEARHCPPIENDIGNSRDAYYLYKDIYTDLLKKYKITQIYHMLNGSYGSAFDSMESDEARASASQVQEEIKNVKTILETSKTEVGSFSLNPENSPSYSLSGFDSLSGKTENDDYNLILNNTNDYGILNSSSITVKFSAGLDKSPLVEKSLGFYFVPYIQNADGSWAVSKDEKDKIWLVKPYQKDSDGNWKDTIDVSEFAEEKQAAALTHFKDSRKYLVTVGSYDFTATMNISTAEFLPLVTGKIYALGAVGYDENLNSFVNSNPYGFMFLSSGAAPTLEIEKIDGKPAKSSWYIKNGAGITISGKVTAEEKSTVKITVHDKSNNKVDITGNPVPVFASTDSPLDEHWELKVPNEYFTKTVDSGGKVISSNYTVTISATCGSRTTEKQIAAGYDVDGPNVEIASVLPYAEISKDTVTKYTVNGKFNVKVTVSDEFYKLSETEMTTLSVFSNYGKPNYKELYSFATSSPNFNAEINSRTDLQNIDKENLTIVVTAYDYAGNKTEKSQEIYLDQDTDKPSVKLTNAVLKDEDSSADYTAGYPAGGKKNLFLSGAPVNATVTDDDGIKSIEVNIYDENNVKIKEKSKLIEQSDITSNPYPLSFEVPSDIGTYSVEIIVKDTESELKNDSCKFFFMVDAGKPSIVVNESSNGKYFGKPNGTIKVTGTYSGLAGMKIFRQNVDGWKEIKLQPDSLSQSGSWEDEFPIAADATESSDPVLSKYKIQDTKGRTAEVPFAYYIDNSKPAVTISEIPEKLVQDRMFRFAGTSKDVSSGSFLASGLSSRWYLLKKEPGAGESVESPESESAAEEQGWKQLSGVSEEWNFTHEFKEGTAETFGEGKYTLYVIAFDVAKNASEMINSSFNVDLNVPKIETSYYSGETEPASGSKIIPDNNAVSVLEKPYVFKYSVSDTFGLDSENPVTLKVYKNDSNGAAVELTASESYKNEYAAGVGTVKIFKKTGEAENVQPDGTYIYEITAKDANKKTAVVKRTVILDTTPPVIEIISPSASEWITSSSNKITVNGTASDENGVKAVFWSKTSNVEVPVYSNGAFTVPENWKQLQGTVSWKIADFELTPGDSNKLYLVAFDIYGNKSEVLEKQFKYDGEVPKITSVKITKFAENSTSGIDLELENNYSGYLNSSSSRIKFEASASDNYKLKSLKISAKKDAEESVDWIKNENIENSGLSLDKEFLTGIKNSSEQNYLADGTYKISVSATDVSGQTVVNQYTVIVDTEPPAIAAASLQANSNAAENGYNSSASPVLSVSAGDNGSGISGVYYMVSSSKLNDSIENVTIDSPMTKSDSGYSRKLSLQEGTNYINVKVEDNAGNISYHTADSLLWNVDKTGPVIVFESPDVSAMLSNKVPQNYKIKVSDELSGMMENSEATISLVSKSGEDAAIAPQPNKVQKDAAGNFYIQGIFASEDMGKIQKGDAAELSVKVKDAVGNESSGKLMLTFDNTPPTVSIVNPAADSVNGKISISGIAKDNAGLAKVVVYRSKILPGDAEDYVLASGENAGSYTKIKEFFGSDAYNWEKTDFNTAEFPDDSALTFCVVAEDTAGNIGSSFKKVKIDQDSDRPEIKFTNLVLKEMSQANYKMHKSDTLYGTVTDDDGVQSLYISEDDGNTWSGNLYDGGAWTYSFTDNKEYKLKFKVIDASGTEFISASGSGNMLKSPKLTDAGGNKLGYKVSGNYTLADTYIYLRADTKDPDVRSTYYIISDVKKTFTDEEIKNYATVADSEWRIETGISPVGGKLKYLYWLIDSSDSSGIKSVFANLAGKGEIAPVKTVEISAENKICIFEFDVSSGYPDGNAKLQYIAKDYAERSKQGEISVAIDNTAPVIKINSHKSGASVYGCEVLNLRGTTDDCEKLYVKLTVSADVPDSNFGADNADVIKWERIDEKTSTGSWSIIFKEDTNSGGNIDYYAVKGILNNYYEALFGIDTSETHATEKDMYVWLYGEDSLGNVSVPVNVCLNVNPQGDKPIVTVSYPEQKPGEETFVGGTVRITGSSILGSNSVTVDAVWVQIDPDYRNSFDENWETKLKNLLVSSGLENLYEITSTGNGTIGNAILARGSTASWNLAINENREFNTDENRTMAIRVWAHSSSGKYSEPVVVPFTLDPNSPVIGNTEPLYLVQYEGSDNWGTVARKVKFENNMWIKGTWYLTGSVEDDSGIRDLLWFDESTGSNTKTNLLFSEYVKELSSVAGSAAKNYRFSIPVGKNDSGFGKLKYRLYALEASGDKSAETNLEFQYDNKAPELKATDASYKNELEKTGLRIVQNNGTYTINGSVNENSNSGYNQSGFNRVVLFFTRTLNGKKYVVDPMLSGGASGGGNALEISGLEEKGGIYWQKRSFSYDSDSGKIILNDAPGKSIRAGGLCRIEEIDYIIKSVDYNNKTIVLKTDPSVNSLTGNAYFAVAQIIDNTAIENGTTKEFDFNRSDDPATNGDGDQMVEGVSQSGTTWKWSASIDSSLILDGSIEINLVAFDEAGNSSEVKTYSGTVSNNAPRIAGVIFGSDDNNDGTISDGELVKVYSKIYTALNNDGIRNGYITANQIANDVTIPISKNAEGKYDDVINIKGKFCVRPEIVGGNKGIGYNYSVTRDNSELYKVETITKLSEIHSYGDKIRSAEDGTNLNDIEISLQDMINNNLTNGKSTVFNFTLWDYTDGATPGTDSNSAKLHIYTNVNIYDEESPVVAINPFYWNNSSENSVYYKGGIAQGHIELGSDLPESFFGSSGIYDRDPKVSGIIKIEGTASDNAMLKELYLDIPGLFTNKLVGKYEYASGTGWKWKTNDSLETDGLKTEIENVSFGNAGHEIKWTILVNTAKIDKLAAQDVPVTVRAVDRGRLNSSLGYDERTEAGKESSVTSDSYRIDVVPYITGITTKLSSLKKNNPSVYARTALGHYSVASDEIITISGFNLAEGNSDVTKSISEITTSGEFSITVSGIKTLNNENNNDGRGTYLGETTNETGDYDIYKNYYNRQPNNDNNNFLTDDIILDIWQINSKAAAPVSGMIEQPVMKINPVSGMVGFAFVNGPLYFSMGGKIGNTEYSAQYWMGSYDFFTSVGFAYDKLGYSYGCSAGGDINSAAADKFQLMTSRWGRAGIDQNGSYSNKNSLIMESIGQKDGNGVRIFDKQRIKSPSFATAVHGNSTNLYLAYYDNINDEIRFKYGKTNSTQKTEFGSFKDYDISKDAYVYRNGCVSMIAGSNTGRNAGEYVSIAVVSKEGTAIDDVVVAVWYDATDRCLRYSYNTTPTVDRNTNTDATGWSTPETVFTGDMENAGEWCQIMADKSDDGGIHIAAYDPINLDLVYAYKSNYQASGFETCIVDGYGVVGSNLTLDVAKNAGGKWIPYIGYYATSCVKPKIAYLVDTSSNDPAETWENSIIPTTNTIPLGSQGNNKMNVGVWKDKDSWQIKNSVTGANTGSHSGHSYGATCWDKVYGNGTANPIVGYAIKSASNGFIETAQLK